jgi:homopolymeric O-antigen transport system ATP-binding protein
MSAVAIRAEGLAKRFRLGKRESYRSLRDTLAGMARAPFRALARRGRGDREAETLWALRDVSFTVGHGEVVGIIGRNGAGKSTLLKVLSRITEPTAGRAEVHGRVGSLLEVGTGFHPELTGRENVYLNGAILGMRKAEIDRKFDEIVAFAELERFLDTAVKHYSSGMYMRLAFAVAAHLEPEILLVDEVLAVGDLAFQTKCLKKMQDVSAAGRTVLFVSHNMGAIQRLCPRALLLDEGHLVVDGPTDEVIRAYVAQGALTAAEYSQPHDPSKPINLLSVAMTDRAGRIRRDFRYDEPFHVVVGFEVNAPVRKVGVWAGLRTLQEVWAFGTSDADTDAEQLGEREPGLYTTRVEVPGKWLNAGDYQLVVGITGYSPTTPYDRVEACSFTILDVGTPERLRTGQSRAGVLQPFLPWETERVESADPVAEARAR